MNASFEIYVCKETFKFNAAHFIAYPGFRERLHGHNYRVSVRIEGPVGRDGYVVDFGDIKRATRDLCKGLNERLMVPMKSDVLDIRVENAQVHMTCEDRTTFSFPEDDCAFLPIVHSSAEELAEYLGGQLLAALPLLVDRGITVLEVGVAEAPGQEARYRMRL